MHHPFRTAALAFAAIVLLGGCSYSCTFDLLLTITNADDGEPVPGVTAVLDTYGRDSERNKDPGAGSDIGSSDADGSLVHQFSVSGYTSGDGPWFLKLQKEGFEPTVIDISPHTDARKGREVNPLPVVVKMKPLAKKP